MADAADSDDGYSDEEFEYMSGDSEAESRDDCVEHAERQPSASAAAFRIIDASALNRVQVGTGAPRRAPHRCGLACACCAAKPSPQRRPGAVAAAWL